MTNRTKEAMETSLTAYLTGYIGHDSARREQVRKFPNWQDMARKELERRSIRFIESFPEDELHAIARGEIDPDELLGRIPD
ncbi:MAG: hypothetical protein LBD06_07170 [Candidatus Accumulibacter sp.]|jgi:hypothetical protein|nr:hypothetical protein [Accumulibacter sp.]